MSVVKFFVLIFESYYICIIKVSSPTTGSKVAIPGVTAAYTNALVVRTTVIISDAGSIAEAAGTIVFAAAMILTSVAASVKYYL